jgi:hypothetical protein
LAGCWSVTSGISAKRSSSDADYGLSTNAFLRAPNYGCRGDWERESGVVVMDGVNGRFQARAGRQGFSGAQVSGVLRVGTTGEL